jgi:dihydroflavonol-4-reductase
MGKKVMVTGPGGFIGGYLTQALAERGDEVIAAGITRPDYLDDPRRYPNVRFVSVHLAQPDTFLPALEGVERVYHTAALFSFFQPEKLLHQINAAGTQALGQAAARAGVREFINWSTGALYGLAYGNRPVVETDPPVPHDKYTRSKWAQEQAAFSLNGSKMKVLNLRPAAVYGPGSSYGDASALYLLKRGILCVIPGLEDYYSSHVHVRDMVAAAIHLADRPESYNPLAPAPADLAYNVADDTPMSVKELLTFASKLIPQKGLIGFLPVRVPVIAVRLVAWAAENYARFADTNPLVEIDSIDYIAAGHALSNAKLKATGFSLIHPHIRSGLGDTIAWYEKTNWKIFD